MTANSYIKQHQKLWARRKQIGTDENGYVTHLGDNLFEELSPLARTEFETADGAELRAVGERRAKMHALHSSSALAVNLFHYWKERTSRELLAEVLEIPSRNISTLTFEKQLSISKDVDRAIFPKDPNIDVVIDYSERADKLKAVGIESKFGEAYGQHEGLREAYMQDEKLWETLPSCHKIALDVRGGPVMGLNTPQLLKHALALRNYADGGKFWLVYLWYGSPTAEAAAHFHQLERFQQAVEADGGRFHYITYQEIICRLDGKLGPEHQPYIDYLADRYL